MLLFFVMRFVKGLGVDWKFFVSKYDGMGSVLFSMWIFFEFKSKKKEKNEI